MLPLPSMRKGGHAGRPLNRVALGLSLVARIALAGPTPPADLRLDAVLPPVIPVAPGSIAAPVFGAVEQIGEIAVLPGDPNLVSDDGAGSLSVRLDGRVQNAWAIANRFYTVFPDQFDQLVVFTSFRDTGSPGPRELLCL